MSSRRSGFRAWGSAVALAALVSLQASAQPEKPGDEARRVERLAGLARLWGTVKFLHPWLAYKDIDWDAALVQALPGVSAARDAADYAAAVSQMLAALGDQATELLKAQAPAAAPDQRTVEISWPREGVLHARLNNQASWNIALELAAARVLALEIEKAEAVVLDLREAGSVDQMFQEIGPRLVSRPLRGPSRRYLMHSGYRPQEGTASVAYESAFVTRAAEVFSPRPDAKPRRLVFVASKYSPLPSVVLALLAGGQAGLVADAPADDRMAVRRERVLLADGMSALVRVEELVPLRGWSGPRADVSLAAGEDALPAALRLLDRGEAAARSNGASLALPDYVWKPDRKHPEMTYPSLEYRLLALFRFWSIVDRFYPYKHLIGDWAPVLGEFIPRFEAARDVREYALAVAELAARVADGHTRVFGSPALNDFFGNAAPPLNVRVVEGQVVVTEVDEAATPVGVAIGDVVLQVDGEAVSHRMKRFEKYVAASTREWRAQRLAQLALRGPASSSAVLGLQGSDGQPKQARVVRGGPPRPRAAPEPYERSVPDNLGFVDLRVLSVEQVDAMFEAFKDTKGILFDMRGYPRGAAGAVAARLNTRGARYGATLYRELVKPADDGARLVFQQELPRTDKWKYSGRTVMLIDDRAISEAERTGLFFEAAADTRFVGSRTAGADGELTRFVLPGGLVVFMTGQEVRHADGRQLQRIGLVPHVEVRPTLQGIREGRDEVLERAMRYLRDGS